MKNEKENSRKQEGFLWIALGLLLIAAALFITAFNLYDELRAEKASSQALNCIEEYLVTEPPVEIPTTATEEPDTLLRDERTVIPDYVLAPNMEMPVENINGIDFIGILRIPALELELPVVSQWSYPNLKTAPCRYSGSVYTGNLILAGHNYASHFGNLKKVWEKDTVLFTDMDGNVFCYEVAEQEILKPSDTEAMEEGDWDLTLFTCTPGGRSRVTVRCVRVGE